MTPPNLLYLDAYDSFSNNIISLLRGQLHASVTSIKIDDARFVLNDDAFFAFLDGFDAVVAGPGPGHPANAKDVGLIARLWTLPETHLLPVLGICLGFQSLCLAHGASVERLREPRHGLITPVTHCDWDVFQNAGGIRATQYHSLQVRLGAEEHDGSILWKSGSACEDLLPLAWDLSDSENGRILMATRHHTKPFWGVQYHPESICTNGSGGKVIRQWWRAACAWRGIEKDSPPAKDISIGIKDRIDSGRTSEDLSGVKVHWQSVPLPTGVEVPDLMDMLRDDCVGYEPLLLESGTRKGAPVNPETGRFSIIGVQDAYSIHIQYSSSSHHLQVVRGEQTLLGQSVAISDVFDHLDRFVAERKAIDGPYNVPFWGGLMGYVSYEAGLETIDVKPAQVDPEQPDIWFIFVERSLVVDHVGGVIYLQSLKDDLWINTAASKLKDLTQAVLPAPAIASPVKIFREPDRTPYKANVRACQSQLRAGESYELCLTDITLLQTAEEPWDLYRRLRHLNPAPFGAYLRLSKAAASSAPDLSIASSSPERFLSWSRDGTCQFRPIKGTVKKTPEMTREEVGAILRSPKEQAENLMIVDLIRHDLSGVKGVSSVSVPKLMSIEEYATVYQLVSVITGHAMHPVSVLAASLPPGSMTGAPKKRSCELLRSIEGMTHVRGVYSGVIGFLDVGGGGDFSVAIRTAWRWGGHEGVWRVGAGGAVTVLSEDQAEWEEMRAKRESVMGAFGLAS